MPILLLFLAFFLHTAHTTYAATLPEQSSDLWANVIEDDSLPTAISNTTLGLVPTASSLSDVYIAVTCLLPAPTRRPVFLAEYYAAVQQILIREDALVPRRFELGPAGSGARNFDWRAGHCVIGFFDLKLVVTNSFPIIVVAHVAALIARDCLTPAKGFLGGVARIGPDMGIVGIGNR